MRNVAGALLCILCLLVASACVESVPRAGDATPSPTATPSPSPTITPRPTLTPTPSPTPAPSPTASPTQTPVPPTATPRPTMTPTATAVATPSPTPSPTATPSPTPTVAATATPQQQGLFLRIENIANESVVQGSTVLVKGQTAPDAVVSVNGVVVPVAADGSFQAELALKPGPNQIEVVASDISGDQVSIVLAVVSVPPSTSSTSSTSSATSTG